MTDSDFLLEVLNDPDSPWHGIPVELLTGTYSYDVDSAGGCG